MDKRGRRKFKAEFKAKVAIEALRERESIESLSKKYDLHPNQISQWKKEFLEGSHVVFEKGEGSRKSGSEEELISELYRQIGQLRVDNEWLKKKLN